MSKWKFWKRNKLVLQFRGGDSYAAGNTGGLLLSPPDPPRLYRCGRGHKVSSYYPIGITFTMGEESRTVCACLFCLAEDVERLYKLEEVLE